MAADELNRSGLKTITGYVEGGTLVSRDNWTLCNGNTTVADEITIL